LLAATDYVKAIRKNPRYALAYYDLATVEQFRHHPGLALLHYNNAVAIDPKMTRAWYNMGVIEKHRNFTLSEKYFKKALAINPGMAVAELNLGLLYYNHGNHTLGLTDINLATTMDPTLKSAVPAAIRKYVH
jgi:tetratricopeptide (TPR) repeat protein